MFLNGFFNVFNGCLNVFNGFLMFWHIKPTAGFWNVGKFPGNNCYNSIVPPCLVQAVDSLDYVFAFWSLGQQQVRNTPFLIILIHQPISARFIRLYQVEPLTKCYWLPFQIDPSTCKRESRFTWPLTSIKSIALQVMLRTSSGLQCDISMFCQKHPTNFSTPTARQPFRSLLLE